MYFKSLFSTKGMVLTMIAAIAISAMLPTQGNNLAEGNFYEYGPSRIYNEAAN